MHFQMAHRPDHFEIPADEPESLVAFYRELLGWTFSKVAGFDYWSCKTADGKDDSTGINGAITKKQYREQSVTNYITVADIEVLLRRVEQLGGKILVPRSPVAGMGWYAIVMDPESNPIGFWQKDAKAGVVGGESERS